MTIRLSRKSLAFVAASVVAGAALSLPLAQNASAQVVVDFPTAEFMTTVQPVYYENHAVYWWHNHWLWRDGGSWHSYDHEPPELAQRRAHDPPGRWFYGPKDAHGSGNFGHDVHGGQGGHGRVEHEAPKPAEHGGHEAPHGKR